MNDNATDTPTPLYIIRRADPSGRVYYGLGGTWTARLALAYRYEDHSKVRDFAVKIRTGLGDPSVSVRRLRSRAIQKDAA